MNDTGIHGLLDTMLRRDLVRVVVDMKNGIGEVTKPAGWWGHITEIRRPGTDVNTYGHLNPVVVVTDPSKCDFTHYVLSPEMVEMV